MNLPRAVTVPPRRRMGRRQRALLLLPALATALCALAVFAIGHGPLPIAPHRVIDIIIGALRGADQSSSREALVVLDIRLPRVLLAIMIGANLAVSGALMQSLFRNPLADPRDRRRLVGCCPGCRGYHRPRR